MPIKPENKHRYPPDWKDIRAGILDRAGHKCEWCGAPNYHAREGKGEGAKYHPPESSWKATRAKHPELTVIVLTIAHLDHTPENCNPENLKALCQRCHLNYDRKAKGDEWFRQRFEKEKENET